MRLLGQNGIFSNTLSEFGLKVAQAVSISHQIQTILSLLSRVLGISGPSYYAALTPASIKATFYCSSGLSKGNSSGD